MRTHYDRESEMEPQAAQNQHYVPKFILRNFLCNSKKEQVHVFSKKTEKGFITSIKNIMAERRFHEFQIGDDSLASFEEAVCRVEDRILPAYQSVVEHNRFDGTAEQKEVLSVFIAFQMLRTRSKRDDFEQLARQLGEKIAEIADFEPPFDDLSPPAETLTQMHLQLMWESAGDLADAIASKDFLLMAAPQGRSFYLSDNPVTLYNSGPANSAYGNIGLLCRGIEIFLPLSAGLALAAWCPSLLAEVRERRAGHRRLAATAVLSSKLNGKTPGFDVQRQILALEASRGEDDALIASFENGAPISLTFENMDFYNSLQVSHAREFVVCKQADFELARRFTSEFGGGRGRRLILS